MFTCSDIQYLLSEKIIEGIVPKCEECNEGVVKPDIVFFGEMLPERFHFLADRDFTEADLLIIMGSSLVVQPFASLVDRYTLIISTMLFLTSYSIQIAC